MSDWDRNSALMDEAIDERLGDVISYSANGVVFDDIKGYVLFPEFASGAGPIDEAFDARPQIKIARSKLPYPDPSHRLRAEKLGPGLFRPTGSVPQNQGRYWLFDIAAA